MTAKNITQPLLVLLIEDNRADAELTLLELSHAEFEISADVVDTLADVTSHLAAKAYDLVLADYRLPGWVGPDALQIARQHQPEIPFILVTRTLGDDVAVECLKQGVTDVVLKSRLARLPLAVRRALAEKSLREERKRLEEAQRRSEKVVLEWKQRLELAEKAAVPIGLWEWEVGANSIVWSDEVYSQLGYTSDKAPRVDDFLNRIHPEDRPRVETEIQSVVSGVSQMYEVQFRVIRPDGTTCWLDSRGTMVHGGSPRMIGIAIDITNLKKAQESSQANGENYRLLLSSTAEGIYGLDLNGLCTFCNPAAARMFGYEEPDMLLGKNVHREHHHTRPDGTLYPECECKIYQAFRCGEGTHVDNEIFVRADGTTSFPCEYWSYPIRRRGEVVGCVVTYLDITERKLAEVRLHRSEAKYRSIIETAPYGIFRSSLDGRFLMANPALVSMLGYDSESQVLSLNIERDVYCIPGKRAQLASRLIEAGCLEDVEADWKRKDGRTITVRLGGVPVREESEETEGFQGFVQDVTERKTLAKQFWQAQKMEAVGRLASGVAHDFNNLLMIFGSYAELIKQCKVDDDKVNRYADQLSKAATRGASITRQLLAFSRQQALEPQVLDLNNVVTELGKVLPRLLGEDITVVTTLEPALQPVKLDPGQMEQMFMNLAVNARDAMPKGGRFELKTQNVQLDAAYVAEHRPMTPGAYVRLTVVDTGIGMDAETQARIFEPFFTTKERGKGTGLGLAMVYGTVKQSGGFIWLSSGVGQGTRFDIFFPPAREAISGEWAPRAAMATSGGSETILLVEDEEALRVATCEFLRLRGYTVLMAGDGAEAMRVCDQHTGNIDVILTDLVMPGIDGIELAKAVSARYPDIRVLYMSGYTDRAMELLGAGAVLFQKPVTLSALASKLRAVLESKKPENE